MDGHPQLGVSGAARYNGQDMRESKQTGTPPATQPRTYQRNLYIVGLVVGLLVFLPCLYIAHKHRLTGWQLRVFSDFNNLPGWYTKPALWVTEALGAGYPIAAAVLIPLLYKRYRLAWRFFTAAGATGAVMEIGKVIAKEPRPAALLHGHLHVRAIELGFDSFPSGHAAIATALALTLWLVLPRTWRWVSAFWIVIVDLSRMYLGVHTPLDVVGGTAIGLVVICALQLLPVFIAKPLHLDTETPLLKRGF
jgi:glycosyltransferase 2 family protein